MKKRNFNFFAVIMLTYLFFACNKEPNDAQKPAATTVWGGFLESKLIKIDSTAPFVTGISETEYAKAVFSDSLGSNGTTPVDSVLVNGIALDLSDTSGGSPGFLYSISSDDVSGLNMGSTCNWSVAGGSSVIPSFTYNNSVPYPSFSGVIPDTVLKTNGLNLSLNFANADTVIISIYNDSTSADEVLRKGFPANSSSFNFSASELAGIRTSDFINLRNIFVIEAYKYVYQTFGNKEFLFVKEYEYMGGVWVK